jgi:hypothetical protein
MCLDAKLGRGLTACLASSATFPFRLEYSAMHAFLQIDNANYRWRKAMELKLLPYQISSKHDERMHLDYDLTDD